MSYYGVKWTKGVDVDVAELKDVLLSSEHPLLKIKEIGSGSFTFNNDSGAQTHFLTTHDLGYVPLVRVMCQWYDIDSATKKNTFRNVPLQDKLVGGSVYFEIKIDKDDEELNLITAGFDSNGGAYSLKYVYAVYYDPETF